MCVYVLTLYMCHECMHVCVEVYICAMHMCKHVPTVYAYVHL